MDRTKTQFRRLQELDAVIRSGRYPNCLSFSIDWEVSQKTIQRDIEFMKYSLGAPIEYDRGKQGYYYTDRNWFLPAINVSEGELLALALGAQLAALYQGTPIAERLDKILGKIADALPEIVSVTPGDISRDVSFLGIPARTIDTELWRNLVLAIRRQVAMDVTYRAEAKPIGKSYRIHPWHLANIRGDWYLLGNIPPHDNMTQFALSRFERAELTDTSFSAPAPELIKQRLQETFGQFVRTDAEPLHNVVVAFDAEIAPRIQARQWHPEQKIKLRKDGSGTLEFPAASLEEATRWVLGWGRHVKVHAPKCLKESIVAEILCMNDKNAQD